jgi:hypothetical protein
MFQPVSSASRGDDAGSVSLLRRLLFIAYFIEVGVVLTLMPWSILWERNYFLIVLPGLQDAFTNNFVRGAVSGLGVVNLWAGLADLATLVSSRRS